MIEVVDADEGTVGVQIHRCEAFAGKDVAAEFNVVSNESGEILYALAMLGQQEGIDGPLVLGRITFRAKNEGVSVARFGVGPGQSRITCLRSNGPVPSKVVVNSAWTDALITVGDHRLFLPLGIGQG